MNTLKERQVCHLFLRGGFGVTPGLWSTVRDKQPQKLVRELVRTSRNITPLRTIDFTPPSIAEIRMMSDEEKQELAKQGRQSLRELNIAWINRMATSEAQLREKMTLFWHDHFACRLNHGLVMQIQNNTLREHALGKFGDLLLAISKDPGMLRFLNNQQNRKEAPNENFAREVLELFTVGRGHYTEQDIREAARAFTGWSSNLRGEFVFRKRQHDFGTKTFMGKSGNFDGEDILKIILEQKQTARHLCTKLYRFLVNPIVDETMVEIWATRLYESDYHIGELLEEMLTSDHFYEERNIGARIKSPVEYLVGMMRMLNMNFTRDEAPLMIQKLLGQVLFQPPNVAGWPEDRGWIDSSSMMARLKIPEAVIFSSELNLQTRDDFSGNEDAIKLQDRFVRRLGANINWEPIIGGLRGKPESRIYETLRSYLLQADSPFAGDALVREFVKTGSHEEGVKTLTMRLMTTPEFQLC